MKTSHLTPRETSKRTYFAFPGEVEGGVENPIFLVGLYRVRTSPNIRTNSLELFYGQMINNIFFLLMLTFSVAFVFLSVKTEMDLMCQCLKRTSSTHNCVWTCMLSHLCFSYTKKLSRRSKCKLKPKAHLQQPTPTTSLQAQ